MEREKKRMGLALCGSFCTFDRVLAAAETLTAEGWTITPILSFRAAHTDTRFGEAACTRSSLERICGRPVMDTIPGVEPVGPKKMFDVLVVAPATGNTIAKLAAGIADTPVTLAVKSHLRNGGPVVIAVSTNDGLGANAANIGALMARKHIFFVPFRQDDPEAKPNSLVADFTRIGEAAAEALHGRQLQPVLLGSGTEK